MVDSRSGRTKVFISYSRKDQKWLERLQVHLKPLERAGVIDRWDDTKIKAGANWKEEISDALNFARVAILLITADFLASDFIVDEELPPLLEAAKRGGTIILPVIVGHSQFSRTSLSQFQAANSPETPLARLPEAEQDEVWDKVTGIVEDALKREIFVPKMQEGNTENIQSNTKHNNLENSGFLAALFGWIILNLVIGVPTRISENGWDVVAIISLVFSSIIFFLIIHIINKDKKKKRK